MPLIGFHASHEQIHPAQLLSDVQAAEAAGFDAAMCSDHFGPWSARQGQSGYAWSWLGAALATTNLRMGVVTAPGQRYHPAVHAQKIGTLAAMFPGRFWAALGSGENSNEHITGAVWPRKELRQRRLRECADIIRRMLDGDTVSHDGLVTVDRARLWTLPEQPPNLLAPAVSAGTAAEAAAWADGMITINQPVEVLRSVLDAYRSAGGAGTTAVQVHLSWHTDAAEAERIAHDQWRSNVFDPPVCWDLETPEHFDVVSQEVTPEQVAKSVYISADLGQHSEWLHDLAELGFDEIYLHHVGQQQQPFVDRFGADVLPQLRMAS
ncbi:MAG TPA: TIGR03885 family FMN-dependent LLM class oxidoreductase [Propionibacteriaceae bacterium]|nr:TIGR03885 family FMN-dependent LLM class oxidoreductase [Propionibacteriaceae bacterium]